MTIGELIQILVVKFDEDDEVWLVDQEGAAGTLDDVEQGPPGIVYLS